MGLQARTSRSRKSALFTITLGPVSSLFLSFRPNRRTNICVCSHTCPRFHLSVSPSSLLFLWHLISSVSLGDSDTVSGYLALRLHKLSTSGCWCCIRTSEQESLQPKSLSEASCTAALFLRVRVQEGKCRSNTEDNQFYFRCLKETIFSD